MASRVSFSEREAELLGRLSLDQFLVQWRPKFALIHRWFVQRTTAKDESDVAALKP
jgi:hypothetical protein